MYRILLAMTSAALVWGCAMAPSLPYDETQPLAYPCLGKPTTHNDSDKSDKPRDRWFVHLIRNPPSGPNDQKFASGNYAARIRVWATYESHKNEPNETQLLSFDAGPNDEFVPIRGSHTVIHVDMNKCEAFAPSK
jgi:hypothetical protein